jgi:hypothetical protein
MKNKVAKTHQSDHMTNVKKVEHREIIFARPLAGLRGRPEGDGLEPIKNYPMRTWPMS